MSAGAIDMIFDRIRDGDESAHAALYTLIYHEMRQMAAAKMAREPQGQTLQPTALVHEAWLRLGGDHQPRWRSRSHFFAAAAEAMRRILIDNARRKRAALHGGGWQKVSADITGFELLAPDRNEKEALLVHEALDALEKESPRKAELVKLRYFVGLSLEEAAAALDISISTAKRDWGFSRAWLLREIGRGSPLSSVPRPPA